MKLCDRMENGQRKNPLNLDTDAGVPFFYLLGDDGRNSWNTASNK